MHPIYPPLPWLHTPRLRLGVTTVAEDIWVHILLLGVVYPILLLFLTYFRKYTSSDSHFILMMSCDVTGGGPMEAPIVELSVPALK